MRDAGQVGRYRVEDASLTDGVVADTLGSVLAGTTIGVAAGTTTGAVAGTPGMDADPATRYRADDARRIDGEGEAGGVTVRPSRPAPALGENSSWRGTGLKEEYETARRDSCRADSTGRLVHVVKWRPGEFAAIRSFYLWSEA